MDEIKQIIISVIGTVTKIVLAAIIVMWVIKNASVAYDWGFRIFGEKAVDEEPGFEVSIEISDDTSLASLGDELEEKGLIRSSLLFQIQGKLAKLDDGIDKGYYSLTSAMTVEEMVGILAQGKNADLEDGDDNDNGTSDEKLIPEDINEEDEPYEEGEGESLEEGEDSDADETVEE